MKSDINTPIAYQHSLYTSSQIYIYTSPAKGSVLSVSKTDF